MADDKNLGPVRPEPFGAKMPVRDLVNALSGLIRYAERAGSARGAPPILRCVTFDAIRPGLVRVSHFGIDMAIQIDVEASGAHGATAVPMRTLASFLRAAEAATVEFTKDAEAHALTLVSGPLRASVNAMSRADAPELRAVSENAPEARRFGLAEGVLEWLFRLPHHFVSHEETRYYLNGVCLEIGEKIIAVATDGHRLGTRQTTPAAPVEAREPIIVPHFAVTAALGLAKGREVTIRLDDTRADFEFGDTVIRTKLIDGTFPNWRRVIPQGPFETMEIEAGRVVKFARGAAGLNVGRFHDFRAVKVSGTDGGIKLSMRSPDIGEIETVIPGKFPARTVASRLLEDKPFEAIGMNVHYLKGIASALGAKRIKVSLTAPNDPMRLESPDSPEGEFTVLMPMRV